MGGVEGVKEQLYVFPVFCGLVTKEHIFDSELTHSSDLDRYKVLSKLTLSYCFTPGWSSLMFLLIKSDIWT